MTGGDMKHIVIVGDGMCGKTSLLNVFLHQNFPVMYMPTICENHSCVVSVDKDEEMTLCFSDTGVDEDFEVFRPLLYRNASVFVVMYSVDRPESLENVCKKWVPEVREHCPDAPIILVACKIDLRTGPLVLGDSSAPREVTPISTWQGKQVARRINAVAYRECSALNNQGTIEVFQTAVYKAQMKTSYDLIFSDACREQ